jgi:hypothetical protein
VRGSRLTSSSNAAGSKVFSRSGSSHAAATEGVVAASSPQGFVDGYSQRHQRRNGPPLPHQAEANRQEPHRVMAARDFALGAPVVRIPNVALSVVVPPRAASPPSSSSSDVAARGPAAGARSTRAEGGGGDVRERKTTLTAAAVRDGRHHQNAAAGSRDVVPADLELTARPTGLAVPAAGVVVTGGRAAAQPPSTPTRNGATAAGDGASPSSRWWLW